MGDAAYCRERHAWQTQTGFGTNLRARITAGFKAK